MYTAVIAFCLLSTASGKDFDERSESKSTAEFAEKENGVKKRIVMHSDDAIAAEVLRLRTELESTRAELQNTTKMLNSVLSHVSSLEMKIQNLEVSALNSSYDNVGSVYVRWGKTTCPGDAEMVYHGYFAGKQWNETGGGTENLCLPSDPTWGNYWDGYQGQYSAIYGTETDIADGIFSRDGLYEQDMPCAVCKVRRGTSLMIPARKQCYPGWTLEYWGYLVGASTNGYFAYEHACLDSSPDFLDRGGSNDNQHVLHLAEGHCGSLPCPPYVDGRELTCVVCSK